MLFHMIFLVITYITCSSSENAGSAIFYNKRDKNKCWTENEILKLKARQIFENLIPEGNDPNHIDSKYLKEEIRYFRKCLRVVEKTADPQAAGILKEALADTLGAHLRKDILPAARFAFYAGYVPYRKVKQLHNLFEEQKEFLNTKGVGWKKPDPIPQWSNITVSKIQIGVDPIFDPCSILITKRDANSCIQVPMPKLDDEKEPSSIVLPFKMSEYMSLTSPKANNILLKYFTTASKCILGSSPQKCRHADYLSFNNEMWHWMKRHVAPHLADETLYTAFGGALRIAAAVQGYGRGLAHRLDDRDAGPAPPAWRALASTLVKAEQVDWTPKLYVALVVLTAVVICLMQMCYTYMCQDCCKCGRGVFTEYRVFSAPQSTVFSNEHKITEAVTEVPPKKGVFARTANPRIEVTETERAKPTASYVRSKSLGSIRTQKVYDLNENTELLMDILSGDSEPPYTSSSDSESGADASSRAGAAAGAGAGAASPPRIEAAVSQVGAHYSASTVRGRAWSSSCSSCSSSSLSRASRRSSPRDSRRSTHSYVKTELDFTSFTTPPSHR